MSILTIRAIRLEMIYGFQGSEPGPCASPELPLALIAQTMWWDPKFVRWKAERQVLGQKPNG